MKNVTFPGAKFKTDIVTLKELSGATKSGLHTTCPEFLVLLMQTALGRK